MYEVSFNFNGPVQEMTEKEGEEDPEYRDVSFFRGKRLIYDSGTLYANIFHDQIHQYNCFTQELKIIPVKEKWRVLTTCKYGHYNYAFNNMIYRSGFLCYDLESSKMKILAASMNSQNLEEVETLDRTLD